MIIFQCHIESLDRFRIILVKQSSAEYSQVETLIGDRRWGCLYEDIEPITQSALQNAHHDLDIAISHPFEGITPEVVRHETRITRIARSAVFREIVRREYNYQCAVTGIEISTPTHLYEVQAAHIIPISEGGQDDPRNGLSLCQTMHWAFDHGLFGIDPNTRRVIIPERIRNNERNEYVVQFENRVISETTSERYRAHENALNWHFENKVKQWN
ncbi:MAG: HNH endonuclease [Calditrichaeota bacterium]|nr:HNH endonuclease [Calditrichota bacterium]